MTVKARAREPEDPDPHGHHRRLPASSPAQGPMSRCRRSRARPWCPRPPRTATSPTWSRCCARPWPDLWPDAAQALAPVAGSADPAERIAFACEYLMRGVYAYQGAVRAMISHTIAAPAPAQARPGIRFDLIDYALAPFEDAGRPPSLHPGGDGPPEGRPRDRRQRRGAVRAHRPVRAPARRRDRERGARRRHADRRRLRRPSRGLTGAAAGWRPAVNVGETHCYVPSIRRR